MILSKRSNGNFYVIYKQKNGKRTKISTHTKNKAEALKFIASFEKHIEEKTKSKPISISFNECCELFLKYSRLIHTQKTNKAYEQTLKHLKSYIGNIPINDISFNALNDYFQYRLDSSSVYQARKDLICLNSFFKRAIDEGLITKNPCDKIKRFRIPQKQPVFFSEIEFQTLIENIADNDIKDLVLFAQQTGMRQMELITLNWSQINFEERLVILDNHNHLTKSKKIRSIPLSQLAFSILTHRKKLRCSELVFLYKGKTISQNLITHMFKKIIRRSNISGNKNFHSLRHTFASWLVQRGVSIYEVSKLLGHSRVDVTQIYSHLRNEDLRKSIELLN